MKINKDTVRLWIAGLRQCDWLKIKIKMPGNSGRGSAKKRMVWPSIKGGFMLESKNITLTEKNIDDISHNVKLENEKIRAQIVEILKERGISESRLAREAGLSLQTVSAWLQGRYGKSDIASVEASLQSWVSRANESHEMDFTFIPGWVPTPTARRINNTFKYAHKMADISVIFGGAGIGKTITAEHYQGNNENVWLATMSASTSSVPACLERVAYAIGLATIPSSAARIEQAIIHRIKGSRGLLIVDEAQHLPMPCLDALRGIFDASGVGLAIMGNESVYTQLTGGSRKAHFAQLFSRIGKRERLTMPSPGDIDIIIDAWRIIQPKARTICHEIGLKAGALRMLTKVLRMARLMMLEDESELTYQTIKTAWSDLGGMA